MLFYSKITFQNHNQGPCVALNLVAVLVETRVQSPITTGILWSGLSEKARKNGKIGDWLLVNSQIWIVGHLVWVLVKA